MVSGFKQIISVFITAMAAVFLSFNPAWADSAGKFMENRPSPELEFSEHLTPNFRILYPAHLSHLVPSMAVLAENVHDRVGSTLDWQPATRTSLVLSDSMDHGSAFTSAFPEPKIHFNLTLPDPTQDMNDYAEWHEWLLLHEYTHVAHLEMRKGTYGWLSPVFGAWVRPNMVTPAWLKEGLAVFTETQLTPKGRGNGSLYRMLFRAAVAEGRLRDKRFANPGNIAHFEDTGWPWTLRPYLFGFSLVETLHEQCGQALAPIAWATAGTAPFDLRPLFKRCGISSFKILWETTLKKIENRAEKELNAIRRTPRTKLQYLTDEGQIYKGLSISLLGDRLITTRDETGIENALLEFGIHESGLSKPSRIQLRGTGFQTSFSNSGRFLVFDQLLRAQKHFQLNDLHIYDLKKKKVISVSPYLRAREPDVHPDGKHIVYVATHGGETALIETDTSWKKQVTLFDPGGQRRISGPRYSPDGSRIVFSLHNSETGGDDLWLFDESGATPIVVGGDDGSHSLYPSWTKKGEEILFSSDRDGVFNVYAYRLKEKKLYRISNVEGGLFFPVADPKRNWIYAISYRSKGYDLVRFQWNTRSWKTIQWSPPRKARDVSQKQPATDSRSIEKQALSSAPPLPQHLRPALVFQRYSSQFGLIFGGTDTLEQQTYSLDLRYDTASGLPVGQLSYLNGRSRFAWDLQLSHSAFHAAGVDSGFSIFQGKSSLYLPLTKEGTHYHLLPGIEFFSAHTLSSTPAVGPTLGIRYDTRFKDFTYSFYEKGAYIDGRFAYLMRPEAGTPWSLVFKSKIEKHFPLWARRHALHLELNGAIFLAGTPGPESIFAIGGQESFPYGSTGGAFTIYSYPPDLVFNSLGLGTLDVLYTFPLADFRKGFALLPFYFGRLSLGTRFQAAALEGPNGSLLALPSLGIELYQDLLAAQVFGLTSKLGVYWGPPEQGGEFQVTFSILSRDF